MRIISSSELVVDTVGVAAILPRPVRRFSTTFRTAVSPLFYSLFFLSGVWTRVISAVSFAVVDTVGGLNASIRKHSKS